MLKKYFQWLKLEKEVQKEILKECHTECGDPEKLTELENDFRELEAINAKHDYDSVTHVDGTARVQIVKKDCKSSIRQILEEWYGQTQCPILLNTSLNIKGEPIVNTWDDAIHFMRETNVYVF